MIFKPLSLIYNFSSFLSQNPNPFFKDTIFALSTGSIKAGVSIIRVSGPNTLKSLALLQPVHSKLHDDFMNHCEKSEILKMFGIKEKFAHFRKFYELLSQNTQLDKRVLIDQGIFIYFPEGKSFTGEEIAEFHIHGSKAIQTKFLHELSKIQQFRMAEQGEFSKRAFLNGKMDLLQVEGLADLINAETEEQRIQSLHQHVGEASELLEKWRIEMIRCLAHVEAFIDFESDEEDVQNDVFSKTNQKIKNIVKEIEFHLNDHHKGEIIRDGYNVSLIGPPNSGKSTLINLLSKRDVAIVSDIPGTTRDIITVSLNIAGFQINLFDTAGLRESDDILEKEGMKRSLVASGNSNVNLFIVDLDDVEVDIPAGSLRFKAGVINEEIKQTIKKTNTVCLINKIDKFPGLKFPENVAKLTCEIENLQEFLFISCKEQINISNLISMVKKHLDNDINIINFAGVKIITKMRHRIELENCLKHLNHFLKSELPIDVCGEELRNAVNCLGKIVGRIDVEEVLDVLFQDFCIGK